MVKGISLLLSWQICAGFLSFPLCVVCVLACERFKTTHHKIRMAVVFFSHSQFLYRDQLLNQDCTACYHLLGQRLRDYSRERGRKGFLSLFFLSHMSRLCIFVLLLYASTAYCGLQHSCHFRMHARRRTTIEISFGTFFIVLCWILLLVSSLYHTCLEIFPV